MKKRVMDRLVPVVAKLQPVARIAERVAGLAVHVQKPTLLGVTGMAAAGLSAFPDYLGNSRSPGWNYSVLMSKGQVIEALREAGASITINRHGNDESVNGLIHATRFFVNPNGSISTTSEVGPEFAEWLRQAIDRTLPNAVEVRRKPTRGGESASYESRPLTLSTFSNDQAVEIMRSTLPLLDGGRCILLDGRPGVGKTTMAQIIAREANLGRTALLDATIVGHARTYDEPPAIAGGSRDLQDAVRLLSAGVVIVDDIDKISLSLANLEALRSESRLVILTANNGQYDEVLDGALMRAGRVDEVFTIQPTSLAREAPFDRLNDEEWAEVSQWPVAYVVEVRKRLLARPDALRLDDLRARLTRKTRSGKHLL